MPQDNWLPAQIIGQADVMRILRELETYEQAIQQASLRKDATPQAPQISKHLQQTVEFVGKDLTQPLQLGELKKWLQDLRKQAPVIHISFTANPSGEFLQKITTWFRKEINPLTLLQVGMQPSIAAGCTVRTNSKYFDMSLRAHLQGKNELLFERLHEVTHE